MAFVAVVHNNHLTFNGKNYFRGSSESFTIGSYGEKKTPIGSANYLEKQDDMPADRLSITTATIVDIDFTKSKSADVRAGLVVAGANVDANTAVSRLQSGQLKLVKLEMSLGPLRDAVNGTGAVLRDLQSYGRDARVVCQIFVVLEASLANSFAASGDIRFSRSGTQLRMTVGTSGTTTVTFSAGTTYAYLLAEPDWDRGRNRIEKFTDDQWGLS